LCTVMWNFESPITCTNWCLCFADPLQFDFKKMSCKAVEYQHVEAVVHIFA